MTPSRDHDRPVNTPPQRTAPSKPPRVEEHIQHDDREPHEHSIDRQIRFYAVGTGLEIHGNTNLVDAPCNCDVCSMPEIGHVHLDPRGDQQTGWPPQVDGPTTDAGDTEQCWLTRRHGNYNTRVRDDSVPFASRHAFGGKPDSLGRHGEDRLSAAMQAGRSERLAQGSAPGRFVAAFCRPGHSATPSATSRRAMVERSGHARPASTLRIVT